MEEIVMATGEVNSVQAVLEGGPLTIPSTSRLQTVSSHDEKVKLPHYGGYEHFERTDNHAGTNSWRQIIFRWTMRTELAE